MTYGTRTAAPVAPKRVGLNLATVAALAASVAILAGGLIYVQRLDADYRDLGASPGALGEVAFRFLHSGAWLTAGLVLAACVIAGAYLLARSHVAWLVLLAPLAFLLVSAVSLKLISVPLQSIVEVVK